MKRILLLILCFVLFGGVVFSIDLLPIGRDLELFLEQVGKASVPFLQQAALTGEGLGIAQFNHDTSWYIAVTPAVVFSKGLLNFAAQEDVFELLNVNGLVTDGLDQAGVGTGFTDDDAILLLPYVRLNVGFAMPLGLEMSLIFSVFPQFIADLAGSAIGYDGLTLNRWNAGIRLRKPLISDSGGFPAISLGVGYTISNFNLGIQLPADFTQDISGSPLDVSGSLSITTWLHTFGVDLALSKKFGVFVPFVKLSSYYQIASFNGAIEGFEATVLADTYTGQGGEDPEADITRSDLSFLTTAGFEILLGKFAFLFDGNYSFSTYSFAVNFGMRLGF